MIPLPDGLPAPVERFYLQVYGEEVPVITSAVFSGRATLRPVSSFPAFPSRYRFTHTAGQDYRHYLEITMFGLPLIKGNEHFLEGKGRMDLGRSVSVKGPEWTRLPTSACGQNPSGCHPYGSPIHASASNLLMT